jgi:hypothetical protein
MQRHHKLSRAKAALLLCLQNSRIFELAKMVVLGALAVKQPHYLEFHVFDLLLLLVKNKNGFLLLSLVSLEFIITIAIIIIIYWQRQRKLVHIHIPRKFACLI